MGYDLVRPVEGCFWFYPPLRVASADPNKTLLGRSLRTWGENVACWKTWCWWWLSMIFPLKLTYYNRDLPLPVWLPKVSWFPTKPAPFAPLLRQLTKCCSKAAKAQYASQRHMGCQLLATDMMSYNYWIMEEHHNMIQLICIIVCDIKVYIPWQGPLIAIIFEVVFAIFWVGHDNHDVFPSGLTPMVKCMPWKASSKARFLGTKMVSPNNDQ